MSSRTLQITHRPEDQCFFVSTANGVSELRYQLDGRHIDFYKTFVIPADRHKGVAYALASHAVQWAEQQQYTLHASCWYVSKYLDRHSKR